MVVVGVFGLLVLVGFRFGVCLCLFFVFVVCVVLFVDV